MTEHNFGHRAVHVGPPKTALVQFLRTDPQTATVIHDQFQAVAPRIRENENVPALRSAAQMIAHQTVETIEVLAHVRRAGCNIYPRRRSKPEHRLSCPIRPPAAPAFLHQSRDALRSGVRRATQPPEHYRDPHPCLDFAQWTKALRQEESIRYSMALPCAPADDIYPAFLLPGRVARKMLPAAIHWLQTPQPAPRPRPDCAVSAPLLLRSFIKSTTKRSRRIGCVSLTDTNEHR